jgi:hypothetical protein
MNFNYFCVLISPRFLRRKVHVTAQTLQLLDGEYYFEDGTENAKNDAFLARNNIRTFLIVPMYRPCEDVINYNQPFFNTSLINRSTGTKENERR